MGRPPWCGVELRRLAALAAVARESSFRGAADSLGYVQSAVSEQIANLERAVGARLVDRRRGAAPVALTEAGQLLLNHFDEVHAQLGAAQAELAALRAGAPGRLRVGVCESVAARLMPFVLRAFARDFPEVPLEVPESGPGDDVARLVGEGELDAALGGMPPKPERFAREEIAQDPYVLVVQAGSPLARAGVPPTAEQLGGVDLVGHACASMRADVEDHLRAHGVEPRIVVRSKLNAAIQAYVAAGMGAAIVPRLALADQDERIATLPLGDLFAPRPIVVYWHAQRQICPALERFVRAASFGCIEAATGAPLPLAA